MSRQGLAVIAFGLGVIAAPIGLMLIDSSAKEVAAQDEDLIVIEPMEDNSDPQTVYLQLAKQKADLLTPDELARETQVLRQELVELQATRKLREAERQLEQLIEQHPRSHAAERAKMMLEGARNPIFAPGRRVPMPNEVFDPNAPDAFRTPAPKYRPNSFDEFDDANPPVRNPKEETVPARRKPRLERGPGPVPLESGEPQS